MQGYFLCSLEVSPFILSLSSKPTYFSLAFKASSTKLNKWEKRVLGSRVINPSDYAPNKRLLLFKGEPKLVDSAEPVKKLVVLPPIDNTYQWFSKFLEQLRYVRATVAETDQPKWWEKNASNMVDIHSTQEFLDALSQAGDKLVIVEFYGTWCASCRALFPKVCMIAEKHPEILFIKVNFDENKSLCKSLNVKVLPYFHFYRGADGLLDSFSCSLAKLQKLKDAIANYNPAHAKES